MTVDDPRPELRLAIPKGRMEEGVRRLLADAGIHVTPTARSYRPHVTLPGCEVKILKPQSIVEMLHAGSRDLGFAGADWVAELDGDLVELLDTGLDPVRVVAAAPVALLAGGGLPGRRLVVASEYERLTARWIAARGLDATLRALLRRDRGLSARGRRPHRRQHRDRLDPARQRTGDRRRADDLVDPALRQPGTPSMIAYRREIDRPAGAAGRARCSRRGGG